MPKNLKGRARPPKARTSGQSADPADAKSHRKPIAFPGEAELVR
jgi:hypothetical protein